MGERVQRDRLREELHRLMKVLDDKLYRKGTRTINRTFHRVRLIVLTAITTGMRISEIFALTWGDILYDESLIAVRSMLKGGRFRYVPLTPELAAEYRRFPSLLGDERILPPKPGAKGDRRRVEGSFETLLDVAKINGLRFHDLRHTFASWYMMNGGDLYELAKILGPFKYQDDGTICEVGAPPYRQDGQHRARDVESPKGRRRTIWDGYPLMCPFRCVPIVFRG